MANESRSIVLNTNYQSAGTKVCVDDLVPRLRQAGHAVTLNDWSHYERYDLALFMSPDADVVEAKQQHPGIVCGIMDPKIDHGYLRDRLSAADFCLVSSIEQRDALSDFDCAIHIYYMFPDISSVNKQHRESKVINIRLVC